MMASHLLNLFFFSALVSTVFAVLLRDDTKSRVRFGVLTFFGFVAAALAVGWVMYPFPS